jgi:enoyl-CoA hydratase
MTGRSSHSPLEAGSPRGHIAREPSVGWTMSTFEHIIVESKGAVGIITLNRPKMLNALSFGVFREIAAAVDDLEADDKIGCILLAGGEKAFAAGADIKEMQPKSFIDMFSSDFTTIGGDRVANCRKPTIAAVSGYALGGGCELAMMCDIIIAADTAKFGQPEITLGTIPGIGGTQRLTRAVGKSLAMDVILSCRFLSAQEALAAGLVARVVGEDEWLDEAKRVAQEIASKAPIATRLAKEGIDRSFEGPLQLGLEYERRLLYLAFASEDTKEGLNAFLEKRKPEFKGR